MWEFYALFKKYDAVIFIGSSMLYELGIKRSIFLLLRSSSLVALTLGSDITEFVRDKGIYPMLYRFFLRKVNFINIVPYPEGIRSLFKKNIYNIFLGRLPYFCKIRQDNYVCAEENQQKTIVFSHCSNIDFGFIDSKAGRTSTKGNDKFIRGFIRAAKEGAPIRCNILDRGPDKDKLKELIASLECESHFVWHAEKTQDTLTDFLLNSDCIVDQFDVGGFGMIAMEAMAQAKPVMIHIDKNYWPLVYDEEPPVINCHTEDEIYNAILDWADKKKLKDLGEKAEKWVRKYHDVHTADFSEFILRVCLAAGLEWPRKDLAEQDT